MKTVGSVLFVTIDFPHQPGSTFPIKRINVGPLIVGNLSRDEWCKLHEYIFIIALRESDKVHKNIYLNMIKFSIT